MDCCPQGSSVQETCQSRILEWVAISFSRGYSWPRAIWATWEIQRNNKLGNSPIVQWLRLRTSAAGQQVGSLVGELRCCMLQGQKQKQNKKSQQTKIICKSKLCGGRMLHSTVWKTAAKYSFHLCKHMPLPPSGGEVYFSSLIWTCFGQRYAAKVTQCQLWT